MSNINPDPFTTRPEIEGTFGVVTSTHWIANRVGMGILEKGGNAFDAGVATAFTLQVSSRILNARAGRAIIVHDMKPPHRGEFCGQGPAPSGRTIAHYRREGLEMVPGTGLHRGLRPRHLRILDAAAARLRHHETPRCAGAGDRLRPRRLSAGRSARPQRSRSSNNCSASTGRHRPQSICRTNEVPNPPLFTNKTLSENLCPHPERGPKAPAGDRHSADRKRAQGWSHGFVAEAIRHILPHPEIMDVSGSPHRGVLSADDMARWQPTIEAPLTYDYGRYTVCKPGVWSQGP